MDAIVDTPSGAARGMTVHLDDTSVTAFLGIPYATAQRFRAPSHSAPWSGVRDAVRVGPAAPQNPDPVRTSAGAPGPVISEDCLNLNIWVPDDGETGRPVMVWVHGGGYVSGSNAESYTKGARLASAGNVVVVSINYRLGALGFLKLDHLLGDEHADSANLAVLDQLAALEWIRDNIRTFGGDPARVTVFGESAGAAAVGTLLGTPRASGLFRRAIMQSGTAERVRIADDAERVTAELLTAAGISSDPARILEIPLDRLLTAQQDVADRHAQKRIGLTFPFQPTIGTTVLPHSPLDAIAAGLNAEVELLAGTNLNEASFYVSSLDSLRLSPEDAFHMAVQEDFAQGPETAIAYSDALRRTIDGPVDAAHTLEAYLSDRMYRQPTNRLLQTRSEAGTRNHAYLFTWPSPLMNGTLGASHILDVPFVFRTLHDPDMSALVGDAPPVALSDQMSTAWASFARNGTPAAPGLPDWSGWDTHQRMTMLLDRESRVSSDPRPALRAFWNDHTTEREKKEGRSRDQLSG